MNRALPWATVDDFDIRMTAVDADGVGVDGVIDQEHHAASLAEVGTWSVASFTVECPQPEDLADPDMAALAVLQNPPTRTHISAPLRRTNGIFEGRLDVHRSAVRDRAQLSVVFSATIDGVRHRVRGQSRTWTIDFDEPISRFNAGKVPIQMVWDSFSNPEFGPAELRSYPKEPFYLFMSGMEPILYLNRDNRELHDLLLYDTATTWKRDLRDAVAVDIAGKVLTMLAWAAVEQTIEEEDGEISPPSGEVLTGTLEALAQHMEGVADVTELHKRIAYVRREGSADDYARLVSNIGAAIDRMLSAGELVSRFGKRALQ